MNRNITLLGTICALALAASATAQETAYDAQRFKPVISQSVNYFSLHQARILPSYELGLFLNYADSPLVLQDDEGERAAELVSHQLTGHILAAVGIADRVELGLDIPLILSQNGDLVRDAAQLSAPDAGFGLGDIRLMTKVLLFGPDADEAGVAMALNVDWYLPTSGAEDYQGESFRAEPRLALDIITGTGIRVGLNLGALFREQVGADNLTVDDTITYGIAAAIPVGDSQRVSIVPELRGETVLGAEEFDTEEAPLEWALGVKYLSEGGAFIEGGFGTGLINGFGVPDWRLFVAFSYAGEGVRDTDGDGYNDNEDVCPDHPEDFDNFEDQDGCPDRDNDQDGIPDRTDSCPNDPEDLDGFQDLDGCPDPDNDGDGLPDIGDRCPNEPEDRDGDRDDDGCPDGDRDGDGLADDVDMCPDDAEDRDGFEDTDGCPDYDHDYDGILPPTDQCPDVAEDFDGDRDEDGCPEGPIVTCDEIVIDEAVQFETASDVIQSVSYGLLDQVAALLIATPGIELIEVQGHTDDRGSDDYNLELSDQRANSVMVYLNSAGVDIQRLTARGYGEIAPIETNETEEGRAANRRVVFRILQQELECD